MPMHVNNSIILAALEKSKRIGIILHTKTEDELWAYPDCDRQFIEDVAKALERYFLREEERDNNAKNKKHRL